MKISDAVVGASFVVAGAVVYAGTLGYPSLDDGHPGPALFPRILAVLMGLFGGALVAFRLRGGAGPPGAWPRGRQAVNLALVLGAVAAYILLVEHLGFLLTAALLVFGLMVAMEVRPFAAACIAASVTAGAYVLFARVLLVPLQRGPWGW